MKRLRTCLSARLRTTRTKPPGLISTAVYLCIMLHSAAPADAQSLEPAPEAVSPADQSQAAPQTVPIADHDQLAPQAVPLRPAIRDKQSDSPSANAQGEDSLMQAETSEAAVFVTPEEI